jgi:hypothetical protein
VRHLRYDRNDLHSRRSYARHAGRKNQPAHARCDEAKETRKGDVLLHEAKLRSTEGSNILRETRPIVTGAAKQILSRKIVPSHRFALVRFGKRNEQWFQPEVHGL